MLKHVSFELLPHVFKIRFLGQVSKVRLLSVLPPPIFLACFYPVSVSKRVAGDWGSLCFHGAAAGRDCENHIHPTMLLLNQWQECVRSDMSAHINLLLYTKTHTDLNTHTGPDHNTQSLLNLTKTSHFSIHILSTSNCEKWRSNVLPTVKREPQFCLLAAQTLWNS